MSVIHYESRLKLTIKSKFIKNTAWNKVLDTTQRCVTITWEYAFCFLFYNSRKQQPLTRARVCMSASHHIFSFKYMYVWQKLKWNLHKSGFNKSFTAFIWFSVVQTGLYKIVIASARARSEANYFSYVCPRARACSSCAILYQLTFTLKNRSGWWV